MYFDVDVKLFSKTNSNIIIATYVYQHYLSAHNMKHFITMVISTIEWAND